MSNRSARPAALLSALLRRIPGVPTVLGKCAGNTLSPQYCYSVWMRHWSHISAFCENRVPRSVAELGPGPSLGTIAASLLCGAERGIALDTSLHADSTERNVRVFDALAEMFKRRDAIPVNGPSLCDVKPPIDDLSFPHPLLPEEALASSLSPHRLQAIRTALAECRPPLAYVAPWQDDRVIERESVDLIFSQAVLEHVTDLSSVYASCRAWLRPGGLMSHQIDFRCHGTARHWNGHYTYSDKAWAFLSRARPYLINREPLSAHLRLLRDNGFEILRLLPCTTPSEIKATDLAPRFSAMSASDLECSGAYIISRRSQ